MVYTPFLHISEIQCNTLDIGGNNVKWIDGTDLGLGCLGFVNSPMLSYDAEIYCSSLSGSLHLVEIFNQAQQNFLKLKAKQISHNSGRNYWIGLKRMGPSTWKWIHSKKYPQFTSWLPNSNGPNEGIFDSPLASIYHFQDYNWVDMNRHVKFYPLCQLDNDCVVGQFLTCNHPIMIGFNQCVDDWCFQMGTHQQYTKCKR